MKITSSAGVAVEVLLGDVPSAAYPILARSGDLSYTFNLYTMHFGSCGGYPDYEPVLTSVYSADQYGNNINAGAPGSQIPVKARFYFLREEETTQDYEVSC